MPECLPPMDVPLVYTYRASSLAPLRFPPHDVAKAPCCCPRSVVETQQRGWLRHDAPLLAAGRAQCSTDDRSFGSQEFGRRDLPATTATLGCIRIPFCRNFYDQAQGSRHLTSWRAGFSDVIIFLSFGTTFDASGEMQGQEALALSFQFYYRVFVLCCCVPSL